MRIPLLLGAFAAFALALAGCGGATARHDFRLDAGKVGSLAAEGAMLAHEVAAGDAWGPYVRVHAGELAGEAASIAAARPGGELAGLAGRVGGWLRALAGGVAAGEAGRIEAALKRASARAGELERRA